MAVIGAGIAGLTAAHLLAQTHEVTLFEADDRLGGHAHTHEVSDSSGLIAVDSGFIVHNRRNYPNLIRLFDELAVPTQETEMSMSVTCRSCGLSYSGGRGLSGIAADPSRLFDRRYLRMLRTIPQFHRAARALLEDDRGDPTWDEFLTAGKYDQYFIDHFATPLVACVWSSADEDALEYPARHLFEFLENHGMLGVKGSPRWRTVVGGSRVYVDAIARRLRERGAEVRTGSAVQSIERDADGVTVNVGGRGERFDGAVLAVHADQALALLSDADAQERSDLSAIGYSQNTVVLHDDDGFLPRARGAKSSWNHHVDCGSRAASAPVQVDYWMNRLMRLEARRELIVSLNPGRPIEQRHVIAEMQYAHPIFTRAAVAAAQRLRESGGPRLAFAGAHLGWGFHEDGCRSGVAAAAKFGAGW